jgi:tetratricopeptide (TPR) repeat protein
VAWVGKDEKTRDALDRFHKLIDSEERLVIAVTYSSVQNTEHNVDTLLSAADEHKQSQKEILGKVDHLSTIVTGKSQILLCFKTNFICPQLLTRPDDKEEELLKNALWTEAVPKTNEIFAEFEKNILKGTCEWLHEEAPFLAWEKEEASLLWVFGGPGAGKSFLATKTILFLRDQHGKNLGQHSKAAVSYFYLKEDNQSLHDLNVILKTIAYQIVQKDETYREYVQSVCGSAEATNTAEKTWKALFLDFYMSTQGAGSSAFIVIDALDEAPLDTRRKLLDLLKVLVNQGPGNRTTIPRLKVAIFGRPDIKDDMEFPRQKFVNVNAQKNRKDINDHILSRLPLVRVLKDMKPKARTKFAKEIRDTILQRADGMFFWAKLVLDQICRKERKSEVQQALQNAPRELDRMIRHVFKRVAADPDINIADLNKILSWVTCAKRPPLLGELHTILRLPTGEPNLSLRRRLKGKFASFIKMSKVGGEDEDEEDGHEEAEEMVPSDKGEEASLDFTNLSDDSDGNDDDSCDDSDNGNDDGNDDDDEGEGEGDKNVIPRKDEFAIDEKAKTQFRTIEISFSHKRIKDYPVQEGGSNPVFVPPEFPKMSIGIDVNKSELELALTCLSILVDGITEDEAEFNLTQYAAENFMRHIEGIDRSKIGKEDKLRLLELITNVFYDDVGLRKLLATTSGDGNGYGYESYKYEYRQKMAFYRTWIGTNIYSKLLRECIGEINTVGTNNFTVGQLEWVKLSATSTREFYRPLMIVSSKLWLSKTGFDDTSYLDILRLHVWLLHSYFMMVSSHSTYRCQTANSQKNDDGSLEYPDENFSLYTRNLNKIPLESMRTYAEWAGLEKTVHWHACLGWVMKDGGYTDAAIVEFKKAVEIDNMAWVAQKGLSRCYHGLDNINLALEWMEKAIQNVPEKFGFLTQEEFLPQVASWLGKIGESERAIEAWKGVWRNNTQNMDNLERYICELHRWGRHQDLVVVITEINSLVSRNEHCETLLVQLLASADNEVFDAIGTAFNVTNATDVRATFLGACTIAITAADAIEADKNKFMQARWTRMEVAAFKYAYCNQTSEAIALWQQTIDLIDNFAASGGSLLVEKRRMCTDPISQILFDDCVEAKGKGEDPAPWIDSLKDLARHNATTAIFDEYKFPVHGAGYASMIYGVWLRDYGGADEAVWKKFFKAGVMPYVDMLINKGGEPSDDIFTWVVSNSSSDSPD